MNLMTGLLGLGGHLRGWRHKDAWSDNVMNLDHAIETARQRNADCSTCCSWLTATPCGRWTSLPCSPPTARPTVPPSSSRSRCSRPWRSTPRISACWPPPPPPRRALLARPPLASLDHLSQGRACWNIVTTSYPDDSLNFSRTKHVAKDLRYERALEFIDITKGLWDSSAKDAFIQDKETGQFLDPTRVRVLNHKGKHFSVKGPLNVARMPQGYPCCSPLASPRTDASSPPGMPTASLPSPIPSPIGQAFYADFERPSGKIWARARFAARHARLRRLCRPHRQRG